MLKRVEGRSPEQSREMDSEQGFKEMEMVSVLAETGIVFAYEKALLAAAKNKHLKPVDLISFVAKQIENFGRQWEAGYINRDRYLSPIRRQRQENERRRRMSPPSDVNSDYGEIRVNQDEWEGEIAEAWPSPRSPSSYEADGEDP